MRIPLLAVLLLAGCQDLAEYAILGGGAGAREAAESGARLELEVGPVVLGGRHVLRVRGAREGETIHVGRSLSGLGPGPCPSFFGGRCMGIRNPVALHTTVRVDGSGAGTRSLGVPDYPALVGRTACFQAAAIRGPGGVDTELSTPVCAGIGHDADADGILDARDACPGSPDDLDWDADGTPDGCDPDGAPPRTEPATWTVPLASWTFASRTVRQHLPDDPVGLVWLLHPEGADGSWFEDPEVVAFLGVLVERGYGLVALDSHDRSTGAWDADPLAANADAQRLEALRVALFAQEALPADLPQHVLGVGGGGAFASWLGGEEGVGAFEAVLLAGSEGPAGQIALRLTTAGAPPSAGEVLLPSPERLVPTRFARSPGVGAAQSVAMFRALIAAGWFDAQGHARIKAEDGAPAALASELEAVVGVDAGVLGALGHVLGTAPLDVDHAEAVAAFLDTFR